MATKVETKWYIWARDMHTNKVIAEHLRKDENAEEVVHCEDGNTRGMWSADYPFINQPYRNAKQGNLKFEVYRKQGLSKAERWKFGPEKKKRTKKEKEAIINKLAKLRRKAA